jgi:mitochondrial fission protein ELM1
LVGEKRGDNAQVVSLAREIGWEYEEKMLFMKPEWREGKPRVRARLDHLDLESSDPLEPPWPDLVITAGRRLSSVALFIKQASQGKTRIVLIGKPRRELESIDLAVVGAHYVLPEGPNVARHDLPLMHADPDTLARAAEHWRPRLADMRRPLTALMVGGRTGGLRFDLATARELFEKTVAGVVASRGSLYITTSRRTPPEVVRMLEEECPRDAALYVFDPDSGPDENPYHGLLALADRFVVTTDSISMMVRSIDSGGRAIPVIFRRSHVFWSKRGLPAGSGRNPSPRPPRTATMRSGASRGGFATSSKLLSRSRGCLRRPALVVPWKESERSRAKRMASR